MGPLSARLLELRGEEEKMRQEIYVYIIFLNILPPLPSAPGPFFFVKRTLQRMGNS